MVRTARGKRFDDTLVVVGSNGGGPEDPGWAHNIRGDGHCWVRYRRRQVPALVPECVKLFGIAQIQPRLFPHPFA